MASNRFNDFTKVVSMVRARSYLLFLILGIVINQNLLTSSAYAEEIPVLIWESGQTQNVVLGQGDSTQTWEVYLKNLNGQKYKFKESQQNRENFSVYSINLPNNFKLGGYVVEAKNLQNNETKQVAGIQVVKNKIKVITRVPFELFLILTGFSLSLFFLREINGASIRLKSEENQRNKKASFFTINLQLRLKYWLERRPKDSLLSKLTLEEIKRDLEIPFWTFILGVSAIAILTFLQFSFGNWYDGDIWLIILLVLASVISFSHGILLSVISISVQLLNIANAKSLSEILTILFLSLIFVVPNLSFQLASKTLDFLLKITNRQLVSLIGSIYGGACTYLLLLLIESLQTNALKNSFFKEILSLLVVSALFLRNFSIAKQDENAKQDLEFHVVRSIGPSWSLGLSFLEGSLIYLWTTNLTVSITSAFCLFLILALNWLEFDMSKFSLFPALSPFFILGLNLVILIAIFLSAQVLPLDVINRSHLMILLIFPIDLLISIYVKVSGDQKISGQEV